MSDLERAVKLANHGEELLATFKELKRYVEAGYGSMDSITPSVQGIRLLGKIMGTLARADRVIAAIEGDGVPVAAAGDANDGGTRTVAPTP